MPHQCGTNTYSGIAEGSAEAISAVDAFVLAERRARSAAEDIRKHYTNMDCPQESDKNCRDKTVRISMIASRPAWVRGEPSTRRGFYHIVVGWEYEVIVDCNEPEPEPEPAPEPQPEPAPEPQPEEEPLPEPEEEPECDGPNPPLAYTAGTRIGASINIPVRSGEDLSTRPPFIAWYAAGPGATLAGWLAGTTCAPGCTIGWDQPPEFTLRTDDRGTFIRCWFELTNDIEAVCR